MQLILILLMHRHRRRRRRRGLPDHNRLAQVVKRPATEGTARVFRTEPVVDAVLVQKMVAGETAEY